MPANDRGTDSSGGKLVRGFDFNVRLPSCWNPIIVRKSRRQMSTKAHWAQPSICSQAARLTKD